MRPCLSLRVRDLSPERQKVAKSFAASMIDQTRAGAGLGLIEERTQESEEEDVPSLRTGRLVDCVAGREVGVVVKRLNKPVASR